MVEQNQTTWRARTAQLYATGALQYPTIPKQMHTKPTAKVKFVCTRMQRNCPWFALHHSNIEEYCSRYGYAYIKDLEWAESAIRAGYTRTGDTATDIEHERIFGSRRLMIEQLANCELLVWLGGDTLITNMTIRLEDVMPDTASFVIPRSGDCYECDSIIVRNSPEGKSLLEDWTSWMLNTDSWVWQQYGDFVPEFAQRQLEENYGIGAKFPVPFAEEMLAHRIKHDDDVLTAVCDRYPEQAARIHTITNRQFVSTHMHWLPGDYILHIPGTTDDEKMRRMLNSIPYIVR